MIIDEAQAIRPHTSQIFKAVHQVKADAFIALSGTPVGNRLLEYWSIMDFVNPGLPGSAETFRREFATPIGASTTLRSSSVSVTSLLPLSCAASRPIVP